MSGERYEIVNINDFLKVPAEKIEQCLNEFRTALSMAFLIEFVSAGKPHPPPMERFTWIDDDKKNITVNLKIVPDQNENDRP